MSRLFHRQRLRAVTSSIRFTRSLVVQHDNAIGEAIRDMINAHGHGNIREMRGGTVREDDARSRQIWKHA